MAACPVCHNDIEITSQHHGTLYTCPHCSAVFFVDWSGQPEGAPPASEELFKPDEPVVSEEYSPDPDYQQDFQLQDAVTSSSTSATAEPEVAATHETSPTSEYDFSQPLDVMVTADPTEPVVSESAPSGLDEIVNFGNADLTQSAFNYTVIISGIDSAAVYASVKEALNDSKFGWNLIQVMTQIKDGVLTIKSVNAVKASILVQRLKYLPVKVSWRQDVLSSHN